MLRLTTFACLATTAASFTACEPRGYAPLSRSQRSAWANRLAQLVAPGAGTPLRATTELAAGWSPVLDEQSGQTYYMNSQTGESQWEPPESTTVRRAKPKGPGSATDTARWRIDGVNGVAGFSGVEGFSADNKYADGQPRMEKAREGRPCQLPYLVGAGEEKVLSRYNMLDQKLSVSLAQCVLRSAADGTATLASLGEAPTLVRAAGGGWNQLYNGETHILSEGDQISLDCDDPEGATFVCNFGFWSWTGSRLDGPPVPMGGQAGGQVGGQCTVQAFSDYAPQQEGELGFRAGDIITVTQQGAPGDWWEGSLNGQAGYFPSNFCSEPQSR